MRWTKEEDEVITNFIHNKEDKTFKDLHEVLSYRTLDSIKMRCRYIKLKNEASHNSSLWTEEKINILINNFESKTIFELCELLGMKYSTVHFKLKIMGLKPKAILKTYTEDDDTYIKQNYKKIKTADIAKKLGVSSDAIIQRAAKLGLNTSNTKNYSQEDKQFLIDNYSKIPLSEICDKLGRTAHSIRSMAYKYNLKPYSKIKYENNIKFILDNYTNMTDSEIANHLSLSIDAVENIRKTNGIYKDPVLINGMSSIERFVKSVLDDNNIEYLYSPSLNNFRPDFLINGNKVIEVNGDYWHCNPYIYSNGPEDDIQEKHVLRDYCKKCYYLSNDIQFIEIWELDIDKDPEIVIEKIKAFCRS